MNLSAFSDRLVEHDALGNRGRSKDVVTGSSSEFGNSARRFAGHIRNPAQNHTYQLEIYVRVVPHLVDQIGDAADPAQAKCRRFSDDERVACDRESATRQIAERRGTPISTAS